MHARSQTVGGEGVSPPPPDGTRMHARSQTVGGEGVSPPTPRRNAYAHMLSDCGWGWGSKRNQPTGILLGILPKTETKNNAQRIYLRGEADQMGCVNGCL